MPTQPQKRRVVASRATNEQLGEALNLLVDYFNSTGITFAGLTLTAPLQLADGTAGAPGLAFAADLDTGIWRNGNNSAVLGAGGASALVWTPSGIQTNNATVLGGLNVGTATGAAAGDVRASGNLTWLSGTANLVTLDHAATAPRTVTVQDLTGTMALLGVPNNGGAGANLLFVDNTYDIGAAGATRPRNLYLAGSEVVDGTATLGAGALAAALHPLVTLQRAAATKGSLGLDALDNLAVLNAAGASVGHVEAGFFLPTVPSVRATASGTTIPNSVNTVLSMDAAAFDTDTMYDAANHRLKATRAGRYAVTGSAKFPGLAAGTFRWTRLRLNGTTTLTEVSTDNPGGTFGPNGTWHSLASLVSLAVGDFITVDAYQDTGGNQTVTGTSTLHFVSN